MTDMQWVFEAVLVALLAATLFHAIRLERALVILRRDRATFDALIAGFNDSTRLAEDGAERLRLAADGAGKQISRQIERASALKEDLIFLTERGEKMADAMERLVTDARSVMPSHMPTLRSRQASTTPARGLENICRDPGPNDPPLRSKAERDLRRALKLGH
jgi:hypothetical protein